MKNLKLFAILLIALTTAPLAFAPVLDEATLKVKMVHALKILRTIIFTYHPFDEDIWEEACALIRAEGLVDPYTCHIGLTMADLHPDDPHNINRAHGILYDAAHCCSNEAFLYILDGTPGLPGDPTLVRTLLQEPWSSWTPLHAAASNKECSPHNIQSITAMLEYFPDPAERLALLRKGEIENHGWTVIKSAQYNHHPTDPARIFLEQQEQEALAAIAATAITH